MYKIGLSGIKITAPIGVYEWEKHKGRHYSVDITLFLSGDTSTVHDKLSATINYEEVYELVVQIAVEPMNLVETFAEKIGNSLLKNYSNVEKVLVRIEKERPMPRSDLNFVFIESEFVR